MARLQQNAFLGKSSARCLLLSWHLWRYRLRLSVLRGEQWAAGGRRGDRGRIFRRRVQVHDPPSDEQQTEAENGRGHASDQKPDGPVTGGAGEELRQSGAQGGRGLHPEDDQDDSDDEEGYSDDALHLSSPLALKALSSSPPLRSPGRTDQANPPLSTAERREGHDILVWDKGKPSVWRARPSALQQVHKTWHCQLNAKNCTYVQ